MADRVWAALDVLEATGTAEDRARCLETLRLVLNNVLEHPTEAKFRRVRLANQRFSSTVIARPGGRELMLAAGFVEEGDALVLHDQTGVAGVRSVLAALRVGRAARPAAVAAISAPPAPLLAAAVTPAGAHTPEPAPLAPPPAAAAKPPHAAEQPRQPERPAQNAGQAMDIDDDEELQAALHMSMAAAPPPAPPPPPTPGAAAPASASARTSIEMLIRSQFARLAAQGVPPTEAAVQALAAAQAELAAAAGATASGSVAARAHGARGAAAAATPAAAAPADDSGVEFVRFEADAVATAASQVDQINAWYAAYGDPFVDPSFPPSARSLYLAPSSATRWKCADCGTLNPLPQLPSMQQLYGPQGDALRRQHRLVCTGCSSEASVEQCLARPSKWLSARADPIRDDVTLQYFESVPWAVFREQPRPDDIRQGALGDCWFVCALSMLAEEPALVRRIFAHDGEATHALCDFNPAGAYLLRLCRAGEWHTVIVDDHFPATELDTFAYSKAARRQLWVPLVEKAAAKLHGSYEALEAGTLAEALTMLTGYATERLLLHRYREGDEDLAALDPARAAAIAALTPEQCAGRERARAEDRAEREHSDADELFLGLLSRRAAGFVMGAACVDRRARELGLQAPHAYGILELTEVDIAQARQAQANGEGSGGARDGDGDGEVVRLVKLRNPAGVSSWAGDWGPRSHLWTHETRQALGVDDEDGGVFWMTFADFVRHFASVEVCRVRPALTEVRARGWLPSKFGLGDAMAVSSFARTELELALYQEGHSARGGSGSRTLLDLGMILLKRSMGQARAEREGDEAGSHEVVALVKRGIHEQAFASATLELDGYEGDYLLVPLCFHQFGSTEPRRFVAAAHSTQPVLLQPTPLAYAELAAALAHVAAEHGERKLIGRSTFVSSWKDEAGAIVLVENASAHEHAHVTIDCDMSTGVLSSRGALLVEDVLPPLNRMISMVITSKAGANKVSWGMAMGTAPGAREAHLPPIEADEPNSGLHTPMPIPPKRRAVLDAAMQLAAPTLDIRNLSAALAHTFNQRRQMPGGGGGGST